VTCLTPSRCIAAASAASAVRPAHASLRAAGNEGAASSGGLFSKIKNALGGGGKPDKPETLDEKLKNVDIVPLDPEPVLTPEAILDGLGK